MTSRSVVLFVAASAALAVACGGPPSPPQNGPSSNDKGARKDLRDDGPGPSKADPSTAALLDKLLADTPSSHAPPPAPTHAPAVAPAPKPAPSHAGGDDTFDDDVKRIKDTVPGWDNGTGIGVRFLKEATGTHLSLIYVDPTPPALNKELGMWVIEAAAKVDGKVVGRIAILSKSLEPGRYEGAPDKKGLIMISAVAEKIDLKDGETMMSTNAGSWSELVLRPGKKAGHIEGNFRAKLVSNNGQSFQTVESGFIYINKLRLVVASGWATIWRWPRTKTASSRSRSSRSRSSRSSRLRPRGRTRGRCSARSTRSSSGSGEVARARCTALACSPGGPMWPSRSCVRGWRRTPTTCAAFAARHAPRPCSTTRTSSRCSSSRAIRRARCSS